MKIKAVAAQLRVPLGSDLKQFIEFLVTQNGNPIQSTRSGDAEERILHIIIKGDLALGLNVMVRDQRSFFQLIRDQKSMRIEMGKAENILEFNYFFIRLDNGATVFTQYRGCGTGLSDFGTLFRAQFSKFKQSSAAPGDGRPKFDRLLTTEAWKSVLQKSKRINSVRLSVQVVGPTDNWFTKNDLSSWSQEYRFKLESNKPRIIKGIEQIVERFSDRRSASVEYQDENDEVIRASLGDNIEVLQRFEYDTIVERIDFKTYANTKLMKAILKYQNESILKTAPKQ